MNRPTDIKFQIAILGGGTASWEAFDAPSGIEWLTCRKPNLHQLEFVLNGATVACLDFEAPRLELPYLLALFVVGDPVEYRLMKNFWTESFGAVQLDIVELPSLDPTLLMSGALSVLAGRLSQERARSGRAALDLAVYRREFERVQHSFSRLEEFVGAQSLFKPMLLFEYPAMPGKLLDGAGPTAAAPPDTAGVRRLVQVLPVDSLGVSGFAIYFHAPPPAGAALQVTLTTMENEQCFATWSIGAADVRIGWLQLALSHAIDQPALSLVVTVELPAGFTYASLALGQPHPYEEFCARSEGATFGAPLALRVFGGLPGVRVTGVGGALHPINSPRPPLTRVSDESYAGVNQVFPVADPERANFVVYDAALNVITVHPHETGVMTVARIDLTAPPGAWRCSAQISLAHELANPVSFGLFAAASAKGSPDAFTGGLDESSVWFSGWVTLTALQSKRISVFTPKTRDGTLSVYLLTRQAPEASPDFAWARFAQFEFNGAPNVFTRASTDSASIRDPRPAKVDMAANDLGDMVDVKGR